MKLRKRNAAFTLIELLVVITIIAILAGIALPVYSTIQERGLQTKALAQAKQIGLALKLYATDNDGKFPATGTPDAQGVALTDPANANAAFKPLIPQYCPSESIFYVAKSTWSNVKPDENISAPANV